MAKRDQWRNQIRWELQTSSSLGTFPFWLQGLSTNPLLVYLDSGQLWETPFLNNLYPDSSTTTSGDTCLGCSWYFDDFAVLSVGWWNRLFGWLTTWASSTSGDMTSSTVLEQTLGKTTSIKSIIVGFCTSALDSKYSKRVLHWRIFVKLK